MDGHPSDQPRIALVWRGDPTSLAADFGRFADVSAALADAGLAPFGCPYDEAAEDAFRARLSACRAALVWVNPVQDGRRRGGLDRILRDAADRGVHVSAHPEVIDRLGVKAVLWRTREIGWSGDAQVYETADALRVEFPAALAAGPRVLKPNRGNGGQGVWKVTALGRGLVEALPASGGPAEVTPLTDFLGSRLAEFDGAEGFVDQAFQPRLTDGMVRCYMSGDRLAGFGWQKVRALAPPHAESGPRTYTGPDDPRFQRLRGLMERTWTPALCRILDIAAKALPAIWDADFMFGPKDSAGGDTFVLCEINASSVHPYPQEAPAAIAQTMAARLSRRSSPTS